MERFNYDTTIKNMEQFIKFHKLDLKNLPPFYTVTHRTLNKGMTKLIELFWIIDNEKAFLGIGSVHGCNMDMGYHVAYVAFETYKEKHNISNEDLPYQKYLKHRLF